MSIDYGGFKLWQLSSFLALCSLHPPFPNGFLLLLRAVLIPGPVLVSSRTRAFLFLGVLVGTSVQPRLPSLSVLLQCASGEHTTFVLEVLLLSFWYGSLSTVPLWAIETVVPCTSILTNTLLTTTVRSHRDTGTELMVKRGPRWTDVVLRGKRCPGVTRTETCRDTVWRSRETRVGF